MTMSNGIADTALGVHSVALTRDAHSLIHEVTRFRRRLPCASSVSLLAVTNRRGTPEERPDCGSGVSSTFSLHLGCLRRHPLACIVWLCFGDFADASGKQHDRQKKKGQLLASQPASVRAKEAWNE